ncbi:MAG: tautomerase family protein [Methanobacteriaceae archaeon]|nr:tautomerase family protein [Methanobacteriaceae archaeon]
MSVDKKRKMVKDISETVAEAYDLPVSAITVLVQAYPSESVGVGGSLLSDLLKE